MYMNSFLCYRIGELEEFILEFEGIIFFYVGELYYE